MKAVDPKFLEAARKVQQRHTAPNRASALQPALVPLAEFRFLGHTLDVMLEFLAAVDIPYTRSPLSAWLRANVGAESGAGSKAEKIVQDAVNAGLYESSHFQPQEAESFRQQKTDAPTKVFDSEISRGRNFKDESVLLTNVAAEAAAAQKKPPPEVAADAKPGSTGPSWMEGLTKTEINQKRQEIVDAGLASFSNPFERIQEKAQALAQNSDNPKVELISNSDSLVEVTKSAANVTNGFATPESLEKEEQRRIRHALRDKALEALKSPLERAFERIQKK